MTGAEGTPEPLPGATSIYVWGNERGTVNWTARRVAARLDRDYLWVQASDPVEECVPAGPVGRPGRSFPVPDLLPRPTVSAKRLRSYLKLTEGPDDLERDLLAFFRMADPLQEAVTDLLGRPLPRVLALGNLDLLPALAASHRSPWGGTFDFLRRHDVTLVASAIGAPRPERIDFEYSIATPEVLPRAVRGIAAVCQWGNCDDCVVNRLFPADEVLCIHRLASDRRTDGFGRVPPIGLALH